jgi:hypothetical protein
MDPQGYDAGKKVAGRKRHTLVAVHPADIQDRDGVAFVLNASTRALFPFLERIFVDGGYQGPRAAATGKWIIEIVKALSCTSSWCYPSGGSSSEPSPGSAAIAASRGFRTLCDHRSRINSPRDDPHHAAPLECQLLGSAIRGDRRPESEPQRRTRGAIMRWLAPVRASQGLGAGVQA